LVDCIFVDPVGMVMLSRRLFKSLVVI